MSSTRILASRASRAAAALLSVSAPMFQVHFASLAYGTFSISTYVLAAIVRKTLNVDLSLTPTKIQLCRTTITIEFAMNRIGHNAPGQACSAQRRYLYHGEGKGSCVANVSYVYNHHERELSERLVNIQHAHHDLTISTMHAHLDHEQCIETVMLKGPVKQVREFAEELMAERGVRHGQLNLISVDLGKPHQHGGSTHRHLKPRL